ncbi:hypothetical protein BDM02DRAFT_2986659 [Thelephora ganbajun]|uniref:Uncharacterized protein n=1 Tax=Thelephora ganbajun TaxID=370292 RepID=A0ACB6ZAW2_THEGA|nr:hypothetical protein BDM02DRAFT_2986659 [Thelephora ganbajun]
MSQAFIPHGEVGPGSATEVAMALRLQNSQHAAILRVPNEILVSILRRVIKNSPGYESAALLITSICHYLRMLAFGTPELWGFVNMRGSLGLIFLQRCQWNPISVVPYFRERDTEGTTRIYTCLDYWKNVPNIHLTRVELIEFCGTRENFAAVSWIFNYHMPNLETLTLASGVLVEGFILDLDPEDVEVWNVNPSTQRTLKDVYLQQILVPWASNVFYGLSTLHLDYRGFIPGATSIPMDPFLEVLSHSPYLKKCTLYFAIPQCHGRELLQDTRPNRIVELPLLEKLTLFDKTLNVAYLLRHLHFPTATKTLLKVDTPPDQLEGLLSTLFPLDSSPMYHTSRVALHQNFTHGRRPVLEIGDTAIQYLNERDVLVITPNDIAHTTFALPLLEVVHRAGPGIRVLTIRLDRGLVTRPEVWRDLLEHLPNLEELIYGSPEDGDHQWSAFWNLLCQTGGDGLICRSLRTLRIISTRGIPSDLVGCLAVRCNLGRPLDVFQLRVWSCERSAAQQIIAHLRLFVVQLIFEVIEESRIVRLA